MYGGFSMDIPKGVFQAVVVLWITIILNVIYEVIKFRLGESTLADFLYALMICAVICIIPYKLSEGSDAARKCFVGLIILYALSILIILSGIYSDSVDITAIDVALSVVLLPANLFILYRLFQPEASSWFSKQDQNIKGHRIEVEYPTILRRYLSTLVDGWFILTLLFILAYFIKDKEDTLYFRLIIVALLLFGYEPLFTSKLCTLGQKIMGIRIRTVGNFQKLNYPAALFRVTIKWLLGFISLFLIIFSKDKRALHDLTSGSIVIYPRHLAS
jgi:uncharacterized RDD family membrane protein YckC